MSEILVPGAVLPDFELPDHTGAMRRLSELQGGDPLILLLSRGEHCPRERQHQREMVKFYEWCAVAYTQLVTIMPNDIHDTNKLRISTGAYWTFLSDGKLEVQRKLDIKEYTDTTHDVMIPHTIVLGRNLEVFQVYNGYYYWGRPSPGELYAALRELARSTYRDWDITEPELRQKWEKGDKSDFYPYGGNSISMETLMLQMAGAVDQYAGEAKKD